jgi:hypothetical protein
MDRYAVKTLRVICQAYYEWEYGIQLAREKLKLSREPFWCLVDSPVPLKSEKEAKLFEKRIRSIANSSLVKTGKLSELSISTYIVKL